MKGTVKQVNDWCLETVLIHGCFPSSSSQIIIYSFFLMVILITEIMNFNMSEIRFAQFDFQSTVTIFPTGKLNQENWKDGRSKKWRGIN